MALLYDLNRLAAMPALVMGPDAPLDTVMLISVLRRPPDQPSGERATSRSAAPAAPEPDDLDHARREDAEWQ